MWRTVKLGDVCDVRRGTTITKNKTVDGNIPVIGGGIKPSYYHNESNRVRDCITISGSGASAGYVNMWSEPIFASDCSTVEPKDDTQHRKFVYYYLCSQQEYINRNFRSGAAQPHVYAKDIATLRYPLVPLAEQHRIAAKLDAVLSEIDKAMSAAERKSQDIQTLQHTAIDELFEKLLNSASMVKLGDVCELVRGPFGGSLKKNIFVPSGYAVYEQQHAIYNQCRTFRYFVDETKYGEMKRFTVLPNDILMSCSGTIGKTTIVPKEAPPGIINQALLKITPKPNVDSEFINLYMATSLFSKQLMDGVEGAAIQNVASVKVLRGIDVLLPTLEVQKIIVSKANSISLEVEKLSELGVQKNLRLKLLKSAILSRELQSEAA